MEDKSKGTLNYKIKKKDKMCKFTDYLLSIRAKEC